MKPYLILIGDIIASRGLHQRAEVQRHFEKSLHNLQKQFAPIITSPLTLTIGDEFQGVFHQGDRLLLLIHTLEKEMYPVRLRFGMGMGEIVTPINKEVAIGMDGSAFHLARQALDEAKEKNKRLVLKILPEFANPLLSVLLDWIDSITKNWDREKLNLLLMVREECKQKEIAARLHKTQPAVSQQINHPHFQLILRSEQILEQQLQKLLVDNTCNRD